MLSLFSIASLRSDPVEPLWAKSVRERLGRATKNPVSATKKQGPQKIRAMADPLLKKVPCPALGKHLGVLRLLKSLSLKHFYLVEF
jgi:hypothetical protein